MIAIGKKKASKQKVKNVKFVVAGVGDKKLKERDRRWRSETIGYILENHTNQNTIYMRPDTGHEIHHDRCMEGVER